MTRSEAVDLLVEWVLQDDRERKDYDNWKAENGIEDGSDETLKHPYGLALFIKSEEK